MLKLKGKVVLILEEKKMQDTIDALTKEMHALRTEIFINRIVFAVSLVVALLYMHFKVEHFGTILGTLIEMFLAG